MKTSKKLLILLVVPLIAITLTGCKSEGVVVVDKCNEVVKKGKLKSMSPFHEYICNDGLCCDLDYADNGKCIRAECFNQSEDDKSE